MALEKKVTDNCTPERAVEGPKVGRPKSAEKRMAILTAGAIAFIEQGIDVSMDQIAKSVGVSKQTVYSHFANKDDLFDAVIASKIDEYFDESSLLRAERLSDELTDRGHRILALFSDPNVARMVRAIASASLAQPDVCQRFWNNGPQMLCNKIAGTLTRHHYPTNDVHATAQSFVHALAGPHMMNAIFDQPMPEHDPVAATWAIVKLFQPAD